MDENMNQSQPVSAAFACYTANRRWTWRDKLRAKLFPIQHAFAPEAPSHFKDCVTVRSITKMSWVDRLRVLITGIVVTHTRTITENEVGDSITAAVCYVGTKRDLKGE